MKKNDLIYLDHILQSLNKVVEYVKDADYESFLQDEEKQDAVIRKKEIVGEAAKRLSKEFRNDYEHIPWKSITGMRDKLIHDYFDIDIDMIWVTATEDIPKLIPSILEIITELEG